MLTIFAFPESRRNPASVCGKDLLLPKIKYQAETFNIYYVHCKVAPSGW